MRRNLMAILASIIVLTACSRAEVSQAPDFALHDINGKMIKLSSYAGKVVIINFWATWCPPCRAELPDFAKFYNSYCPKGIEIIGIAVNSKLEEVKKMANEFNITYPLCMSDGRVESLYGGIRAVPTTFVIDKKGNIRTKKLGMMSESELVKIAEQLL